MGFTLIELLIAMAVIGILSSIILGSINTARGKSSDSKAKAQLSSLRSTAEGYFDANGAGVRLSKASVFRPGRVDVVGRFALAGGMPYAADSVSSVRSLALRFSLPNGEEWRTGMNNIPVFVVKTPEAFNEQLSAMAPEPLPSAAG